MYFLVYGVYYIVLLYNVIFFTVLYIKVIMLHVLDIYHLRLDHRHSNSFECLWLDLEERYKNRDPFPIRPYTYTVLVVQFLHFWYCVHSGEDICMCMMLL
jgi:hypothetical protein